MNRREHLLTVFQEECAELIQVVSKSKRFGLTNTQPSSGKLNIEILNDEWNDLMGIAELLREEGIPIIVDPIKIQQKKEKVEKFLQVSANSGKLK
jgi:hypothetical protein